MTRNSARAGVGMALVLVWAATAGAAPRFEGIIRSGDQPRFALIDDETGANRWVTKGDTFGDFTVSEYRDSERALVLVGDGKEVVLHLRATSIGAPVTVQEPESEWRKAAEEKIAAGDPILEELLSDYDTVTSEAIGIGAFLDFAKKNKPEGISAEDWKSQLAESTKELTLRNTTAQLYKEAILALLKSSAEAPR